MSRRVFPLIFALIVGSLSSSGANDKSAQEQAQDFVDAYVQAWNKKDASAVTKFYTEDASYSDDDGTSLSGHDEIRARLMAVFTNDPDSELSITVESARYLTKGVLCLKGYTTVFSGEDTDLGAMRATCVKVGDDWLLADVHESDLADADPATEAMLQLEPLIGTWKIKSSDQGMKSEASWVLRGKFISRITTTKNEEGDDFVSVELIGYDPGEGEIRSWFFDNEGGFGEGSWRNDGEDWAVDLKVTMPDGGSYSSEHIVTFGDDDTAILKTVNRALNGEVLPSRNEIIVERVSKEAPTPTSR